MLVASAASPPIIEAAIAGAGTPKRLVRASTLGTVPSSASDHSMRVEAYRPELAADRMAARMTTFMMVPAKGIPIALKTVTNGLCSTPAACQGMSALITVIEPMKKMTRRHRVA